MIVWLGFLLCVVREVVRETVFDVYSIYNMESISLCWSIHMLLYNTFKSKQQVCKEMITQGRIIVSCQLIHKVQTVSDNKSLGIAMNWSLWARMRFLLCYSSMP